MVCPCWPSESSNFNWLSEENWFLWYLRNSGEYFIRVKQSHSRIQSHVPESQPYSENRAREARCRLRAALTFRFDKIWCRVCARIDVLRLISSDSRGISTVPSKPAEEDLSLFPFAFQRPSFKQRFRGYWFAGSCWHRSSRTLKEVGSKAEDHLALHEIHSKSKGCFVKLHLQTPWGGKRGARSPGAACNLQNCRYRKNDIVRREQWIAHFSVRLPLKKLVLSMIL